MKHLKTYEISNEDQLKKDQEKVELLRELLKIIKL